MSLYLLCIVAGVVLHKVWRAVWLSIYKRSLSAGVVAEFGPAPTRPRPDRPKSVTEVG